MKTNAIISALCVVGIIGALCSNGKEQRSVVEPRPGALPVQKVVYWSDIPGMKWNWTTQVTNKPSIPTVGTLNTTATSAQSTSSSESLSGNITLHKIAKTGAYGDLSGKPTIPTVGTLNTTLTTAQATSANESLSGTIKLHKVAKTGKLEDLGGSSLTIGNVEAKYVKIKQSGEIEVFDDFGDSVVYTLNLPDKNGILAVLSDIPSTNGLAAKSYVDSHQWTWASITNKPTLATVATSGSYSDLSNKPTIPTIGTLNTTATTAQSTSASESLSGNITLHKVAKTGSYNDLLNKPSIPLASSFVQKSGDTMTGNLTIDPLDDSGSSPAIKVMWSNSMSSKYTMLRHDNLVHGYLNGSSYNIRFQDKSGTMALNEDVVAIIPAWTRSSAVSYTAGDLVLYNSKLYKAKQNIAANQAWNASNWEEVKIASELRSKADTSWVNNHKWDWGTQITNAPSFVPTTRKVNNHALSSDVTLSGLDISATVTSPVGGPDIVNNVQGHLSFLYQDAYNTEQTLNLKADRTEIPTVPTNVSAFNNDAGYVTANHTHSNLVNGTTQVIANTNGTASIVASGGKGLTVPANFAFSNKQVVECGTTVGFTGPYEAANGILFWYPTSIQDPQSFDPTIATDRHVLLGSMNGPTPTYVLMCDSGTVQPMYSISGWNGSSTQLSRKWPDSTYSGENITVGFPMVEAQIATLDDIPAFPSDMVLKWKLDDELSKKVDKGYKHNLIIDNDGVVRVVACRYRGMDSGSGLFAGTDCYMETDGDYYTGSHTEYRFRIRDNVGNLLYYAVAARSGGAPGTWHVIYSNLNAERAALLPPNGTILIYETQTQEGVKGFGVAVQNNEMQMTPWSAFQDSTNMVSTTLVSAEYIKSKVQNINTNLQTAEDTRVALTNLITILKNL